MIKMTMTGMATVVKNLNDYQKKKDAEIQGVVDLTAQLVRTDAIKSMKSSPASGATYQRRTVKHTASGPNNPPRIDTGRLSNSVKALVGKLEAFVGSNVVYAPHLEFGTKNMDARPWLFPAFERQRRNFVNRLKAVLR
jgi:HK97 gp10 family phage protein